MAKSIRDQRDETVLVFKSELFLISVLMRFKNILFFLKFLNQEDLLLLFFCSPVFSVHQPNFHLPKLQFYFWLSAVCAAFYGCNCGSAVSSRALCIARATDLLWDYDFVYHLMGSFRLPPSAEPQTWTKSSPPDDTGVCFKLMLTQVNYMALLMECGFGFYPTLSLFLSVYLFLCLFQIIVDQPVDN